MVHLFKTDYQVRGYPGAGLNERTVIVSMCNLRFLMKDPDWTYKLEFTTCDVCKDTHTLSLLAQAGEP